VKRQRLPGEKEVHEGSHAPIYEAERIFFFLEEQESVLAWIWHGLSGQTPNTTAGDKDPSTTNKEPVKE
jgi:hypothetical protein